jgi:hypothetical protein
VREEVQRWAKNSDYGMKDNWKGGGEGETSLASRQKCHVICDKTT